MPADAFLPDCRTSVVRDRIYRDGLNWIPIWCAHCGKEGPRIPEDNHEFAFYECIACCEKHPPAPGTYRVPDEDFFERMRQAQLEECGHYLSPLEIAGLPDSHPLILLRGDMPQFGG